MDSDLLGDVGHYVPGLLTPLLTDARVDYVKGCYTRPLTIDGEHRPVGGGRVTELTARPLLNALWPELAGFVQPLGGEYAGRRSALEQVPFVSSYGVEVGLLIDLLQVCGLQGLAQVDLGTRTHSHQTDEALGKMAGQIVQHAAVPRRARPARTAAGARRPAHPVQPRRRPVRADQSHRRGRPAPADGHRRRVRRRAGRRRRRLNQSSAADPGRAGSRTGPVRPMVVR